MLQLRIPVCLSFVLIATFASVGTAAPPRLSYEDLVERLCNLERLALLPPVGERGEEATSFSRLSRYDESTDRYINWFHNSYGGGIGDGTGVESVDAAAGEVVMADLKGPGVIWRIWSAAPSDNRVRFYLDDAAEPVLDVPFSAIFSGKKPPFNYRELVYEAGRGKSCYVPIPFQRRCRIVTNTSGFGRYFHFGYTRFPPGTELPRFRLPLEKSELAALARVNKILAQRGESPYPPAKNAVNESNRVVVKPNSSATVFDFPGSSAITELRVKLEGTIPDDRDFLRKLTLSIYWDGEEKPSVWAPLGDFFGSAPGINPYRTLPMGVTDDGFYSFWFMPYSSRARICITNDSSGEVAMTVSASRRPLTKPVAQYARFHAKWHRDAFPPEHPDRRPIDWTMLRTRGAGRYCGVMLHVWNPAGGWWGEGDEKFFVDGEKFPSSFGTGLEDYFGYAWSDPGLFSRAFHAQTFNSRDPSAVPGRPGWKAESHRHASLNRWQIADDVPFQSSFEACMEKYYPNSRGTLFACVAYWYLAPGGEDAYDPLPLSQRIDYLRDPKPVINGSGKE